MTGFPSAVCGAFLSDRFLLIFPSTALISTYRTPASPARKTSSVPLSTRSIISACPSPFPIFLLGLWGTRTLCSIWMPWMEQVAPWICLPRTHSSSYLMFGMAWISDHQLCHRLGRAAKWRNSSCWWAACCDLPHFDAWYRSCWRWTPRTRRSSACCCGHHSWRLRTRNLRHLGIIGTEVEPICLADWIHGRMAINFVDYTAVLQASLLLAFYWICS